MTMQPLKAYVKKGRLVLDEPTDLPEGEIVYLQPVDADDQARLREALRESAVRDHRGGDAAKQDETAQAGPSSEESAGPEASVIVGIDPCPVH